MAAITTAITLPQEYGYVLLAASSQLVLSLWHGMRLGPYRKKAGIPYPQHYATQQEISSATSAEKKRDLYLYNCAQRAHGNFMENFPATIVSLLVVGLQYPKTAAITGGLWSVFRVIYATGYTRSDKEMGKGRLYGSGFWLCQFVLFGLVGYQGFQLAF